jgi:hypothetical protein
MRNTLLLAFFMLTASHLSAQRTVGLLQQNEGDYDTGYILFAPMVNCSTTYLIDKCGRQVHTWTSDYFPQISNYLLDDGSLLRGGGGNGVIDRIDWNGNKMFHYRIFDKYQIQHHDVKLLPNGNILAIVRDIKSRQQAIDAGRDSNNLVNDLYSEKIIEIKPIDKDTYEIVWIWNAWDHLIQQFDSTKPFYGNPADHPELIDLNFLKTKQNDIFHINAVDYNPEFDQILLSTPMYSEVWVIDHSTTPIEAGSHSGGKRGKGGDFLYRWGNPQTYGHGTTTTKKLYGCHNAKWIEPGLPHEGSIILFSNGYNRPGGKNFSTVEIFKPANDANGDYNTLLPYLPAEQDWVYKDSVPTNFFSMVMSGEQILPNGNVLICSATKGLFFEVDSNGKTVWKYKNPVTPKGPVPQDTVGQISNSVFRCTLIPSDHKALAGRNLKPGLPVELNPLPYECNLDPEPVGLDINNQFDPLIYQFNDQVVIDLQIEEYKLRMVNLYGQEVFSGKNVSNINTSHFQPGMYLIQISTSKGEINSKKIIISD